MSEQKKVVEMKASMNVFQRMNQVRREVDYVKKEKEVKGQGYKAVTHDEVTARVRQSLIEHGVMILPDLLISTDELTGAATKTGAKFHRYKGLFEVSFVNADDPQDRVSIKVEAHADDHGDKAPGKALSYATKYAILKMFNIETGEDDESRNAGTYDKRDLAEEHQGVIDKIEAYAESENAVGAFEAFMSLSDDVRDALHEGAPKNPNNWGPFTSKMKKAIKDGDMAHWNGCKSVADSMNEMDEPTALSESWDELSRLEKERVWNVLGADQREMIKQTKEIA